jgi:hypothetical protein
MDYLFMEMPGAAVGVVFAAAWIFLWSACHGAVVPGREELLFSMIQRQMLLIGSLRLVVACLLMPPP